MIRLRTAALGALLLSLVLNACSGGSGGMLPAAQNPASMQSLSGGTTPQSTGRLPSSVNCPSIAASDAARIGIHLPLVHRMGDRPAEPVGAGTTALPTRPGCGSGIARAHIDGTCAASNSCQNKDCPAGGSGGHDACNPPGMGAPPGWNNCVIGCNPTNPGSPIGIPGGPPCRPISSCIATAPVYAPIQGQCDDSPAIDEIGNDNLPGGNSWGTTIGNIYGFRNGQEVYGWVYQTENDNIFFQRNAADTGIAGLTSFFDNVPGLQTIVEALVNSTTSPYQLNGQQWKNIQASMQNSSFRLHKCYLHKYKGAGNGG